MRTARSRTSGEYLLALPMTPSSQGLESPGIPGRFIPPTGRHAETHGCTFGEIKNGKMVRQWIYWDTGHLLRQLGVMPGA
jgi:hypothetical protein